MDIVNNSRLKVIVMRVEDMNKVKNDVLIVNYSLNGMVCGVLVVGVC
jgi:uncharacterized protein YuzE